MELRVARAREIRNLNVTICVCPDFGNNEKLRHRVWGFEKSFLTFFRTWSIQSDSRMIAVRLIVCQRHLQSFKTRKTKIWWKLKDANKWVRTDGVFQRIRDTGNSHLAECQLQMEYTCTYVCRMAAIKGIFNFEYFGFPVA